MKGYLRILAGGCLLLALGAPASGAAQPQALAALAGITEWVSVSSDETPGNNWAKYAYVTDDGRYVAFESWSSNLVEGDNNDTGDVFVRDRVNGVTERVSVSTTGAEGNGSSGLPSISGDGRYVAFESGADNLVSGDGNGSTDIFVRDRVSGTTERVSVSSDEVEADSWSVHPAISADGRYVAFHSAAENLVGDDTNNTYDVFVRDRVDGTTERASVNSVGVEVDHGASAFACISADGRYVGFESWAEDLAPGDTNLVEDVFVHDRVGGGTELVSVASGGVQGDDSSERCSLSGDGRYVTFESWATNLASGDMNDTWDVFVHDRVGGGTELVSVTSGGAAGNDRSENAFISADGRSIAFSSWATDLVSGDANHHADIFVRDRVSGTTELASVASDGRQGNDSSDHPALSADGRYVVFDTWAWNLVSGDISSNSDVLIRRRLGLTYLGDGVIFLPVMCR
jgi:Tol biopolymer transport system component